MPVGRSKRPSFSQGRKRRGANRSTQLAGAASGSTMIVGRGLPDGQARSRGRTA